MLGQGQREGGGGRVWRSCSSRPFLSPLASVLPSAEAAPPGEVTPHAVDAQQVAGLPQEDGNEAEEEVRDQDTDEVACGG